MIIIAIHWLDSLARKRERERTRKRWRSKDEKDQKMQQIKKMKEEKSSAGAIIFSSKTVKTFRSASVPSNLYIQLGTFMFQIWDFFLTLYVGKNSCLKSIEIVSIGTVSVGIVSISCQRLANSCYMILSFSDPDNFIFKSIPGRIWLTWNFCLKS